MSAAAAPPPAVSAAVPQPREARQSSGGRRQKGPNSGGDSASVKSSSKTARSSAPVTPTATVSTLTASTVKADSSSLLAAGFGHLRKHVHDAPAAEATITAKAHPAFHRLAHEYSAFPPIACSTGVFHAAPFSDDLDYAEGLLCAAEALIQGFVCDPSKVYKLDLLGELDAQLQLMRSVRHMPPAAEHASRSIRAAVLSLPPASTQETAVSSLGAALRDYRTNFVVIQSALAAAVVNACGDAETILTYSYSAAILQALQQLSASRPTLEVIIVDAQPSLLARHALAPLTSAGVNVTYALLASVRGLAARADVVLLPAEGVLNDGSILAHAGAVHVAYAAAAAHVRVVAVAPCSVLVDKCVLDASKLNASLPAAAAHASVAFPTSAAPARACTLEACVPSDVEAGADAMTPADEPVMAPLAAAASKGKAAKSSKGVAPEYAPPAWCSPALLLGRATPPAAAAAVPVIALQYDLVPATLVSEHVTELGSMPSSAIDAVMAVMSRVLDATADTDDAAGDALPTRNDTTRGDDLEDA